MVYARTSHNKRYTQIALFGQFGLHKTPVGCALSAGTPFVGFCSATFFCARKNASHFSLSGTKKRRISRTLCEIWAKKVFDKFIHTVVKC